MDHWLSDKLGKADFWVDLTHYGAQFCASLKQVIDFPNLWQYGEGLFADGLAPQGAGARKCASISPRVRRECGVDRCWKYAATPISTEKLSCRPVAGSSAFFIIFKETNRDIDRNDS
jgi:hypothetical protein